MPTLDILDISTTIGCNLQCKGCNHFSNYFTPTSKLDTDQLIEDMGVILPRLDVNRISIIGGEPLLNPRCEEILEACLSYHKNKVYLYSNGILLKKNEKWIRKWLEDPRVYLRISIHIPEVEKIIFDHPKLIVTKHHTVGSMRSSREMWFSSIKRKGDKVYPYNHNRPTKSFKVCSCPNAQLYNGYLWKCPNTAFLKELLHVTEQSDDPEWKYYLGDGLPLDCSDEELTNFCINSRLPEMVCNMCTAKPLHFSSSIQEKVKRKEINTTRS